MSPNQALFPSILNGADYLRNLTPKKVIETMPASLQPSAQRGVERAGKTAEWTKKQIKNIASLSAPEEQPVSIHRTSSPAISDVSTSCDGEDEIFPTIVKVPASEEEKGKTGIKDAMQESFPALLHRYMKNEEPGKSQCKQRSAWRSRRGEGDIIRKKKIRNGEAWKGKMTREDELRWKELQKEWQQKEERSRDDEGNKAMEDMTARMFVPTLGLHLQKGALEHSRIREERSGFVA
jgi:hypothetical protein